MTLIQFKVKTPKVMFPHLEIHVRFKCLNPYHDLQIKDQQHLTVIREKFSWPATKNLVLRLDPTQWVQENMGFADSDKKLVPAYIIPPGTRTSQPYKCNSNYHPEKIQSVLFVSSLLTKVPWQEQKRYTIFAAGIWKVGNIPRKQGYSGQRQHCMTMCAMEQRVSRDAFEARGSSAQAWRPAPIWSNIRHWTCYTSHRNQW